MPVARVAQGFTDVLSTAPSATWTLNLPADRAAGDVYVVVLTLAINTGTSQVSTTPSGAVTAIAPSSGAGNTIHSAVYLLPYASTPPASVSWTLVASHYGSMSWVRFTGADTSNPLSGGAASTWANNVTNTAPSVTTTAGAFVVGGMNMASGSRTTTPPSGWTNIVNATERLGHISSKGVQAAAGSTGTAAFTASGAATYTQAWQLGVREATAVTPSLTQVTVGDVTDTTIAFATKTTNAASVRIKTATDSALTTGVVFSPLLSPDADGYSTHKVTGLTANTEYFYGVEMTPSSGSIVTTASQGSPKTLPTAGVAASYGVGFGSCLDTGSTVTGPFTRIAARDPLMFLHLGDFHYADNTSTAQSSHRADLEGQINANSGLRDLMKTVPTLYIKSDHDAGGGNNALPGTYTAPNRNAYKQVFAHPPLIDTNGLYWSKVVGRVKWIFTDQRYLRTAAPSGSMLGATQKQWFKDELQTSEPVKIWVQDSTFNITDAPAAEDKWSDYVTERDEIANFIATQAVGKVITVHGDQHALAYDNGTNTPGGFVSWCAAPYDRTTSHKGGPWTARYPSTAGAQGNFYGYITVTDSSGTLSLTFNGYDETNTSRVAHTVTVKVASGSSTTTVTTTAVGAGSSKRSGASTAGVTVTTAQAGSSRRSGGSVASVGTAAVSGGRKRGVGSSATGVAITTSSAGTARRVGSSTTSVTATTVSGGVRRANGSSATTVTVTTVGAGTPVTAGQGGSATVVNVSAVGTGAPKKTAGSTAGVVIGTVGAGYAIRRSGSTTGVTVTAVGAGSGPGTIVSGGSVATVTVSAVGLGRKRAAAAAVATVMTTAVAAGKARRAAGSTATVLVAPANASGGVGIPPSGLRDITFTVGRPVGHPMTVKAPRR